MAKRSTLQGVFEGRFEWSRWVWRSRVAGRLRRLRVADLYPHHRLAFHAYKHADTHSYSYTDSNGDADIHAHSNSYSNGDAHLYSHTDADIHAYSNPDSNAHAHSS